MEETLAESEDHTAMKHASATTDLKIDSEDCNQSCDSAEGLVIKFLFLINYCIDAFHTPINARIYFITYIFHIFQLYDHHKYILLEILRQYT